MPPEREGNLQKNKTGGKKVGTKNSPVTKKSSGVKIQGQPVARTSPSDKPAKTSKSELEEVELWTDEEVFEALNAEAERRGLSISVEGHLKKWLIGLIRTSVANISESICGIGTKGKVGVIWSLMEWVARRNERGRIIKNER
jgi:hypothetical protein